MNHIGFISLEDKNSLKKVINDHGRVGVSPGQKSLHFLILECHLKILQTVCPNFIYYIPEKIIGFYNNL